MKVEEDRGEREGELIGGKQIKEVMKTKSRRDRPS